MEWVERKDLGQINLVNDFMDLLKVIDNELLTEFQYVVKKDEWKVQIK